MIPEKITYYAVVGGDRTMDNPYGLVRRLHYADGPEDECLLRDFTWDDTAVIVEWERGDFADELLEVTQGQADNIIGYFRDRWGQDSARSS